jgi:hypothetical protein
MFFREKPSVVLSNFGGTVSAFRLGTSPATVTLFANTDGSMSATFVDSATQNQVSGDTWFGSVSAGIGNTHWVRATATGDTLNSGTTGTWQQLNLARSWSLSSLGGAGGSLRFTNVFLEISTSATGTPVVASGTYFLEANNEV